MKADKFDITKLYPELYKAQQGRGKIVTIPAIRVLAINGEGGRDGPRFIDSISALYDIAFGIMGLANDEFLPDGYVDFTIPALEILWSMKNGNDYNPQLTEQLLWENFVVVPGFVTQRLVDMAIADVRDRKPNSRYQDLHISTLEEKKAAQILHIGSIKNSPKSLQILNKYIAKKGYKPSARYHEIYLNYFIASSSARLRIIIRQPILKI